MMLMRCLALLLAAMPLGATAQTLRVMTLNVRYPAKGDGVNQWEARRPLMADTIRAAQPDVIGTQELFQRQGDDLVRLLPEYRWFGRDRRGAHADEHMGIFYRTDRLTLIRQGDFWLSETPEVPGSESWGVDLPRMANWAIFETRDAAPRRFLFLDTHFAHRDQDDVARTQAARLIVTRLPALAAGLPVILAGDLNGTADSTFHSVLAASLTDAWAAAGKREGPEGTYHGYTGKADKRIDYLFVKGFTPQAVSVDDRHDGRVYPSDHFPVTATLRFDATPAGR